MTTPNETYVFTPFIDKVAMPISGGTTSSDTFKVPQGMKGVTIFMSTLATSASAKIQTLTPNEPTVHTTQTWVDLETFNLSDGSLVALDGITSAHSVSMPTSALGGGILRFTAADTQAGAPTTIFLLWTRDG